MQNALTKLASGTVNAKRKESFIEWERGWRKSETKIDLSSSKGERNAGNARKNNNGRQEELQSFREKEARRRRQHTLHACVKPMASAKNGSNRWVVTCMVLSLCEKRTAH